MDIHYITEQLGLTQAWQKIPGGSRMDAPELDVEKMARLMRDEVARLIAITAAPGAPGETCLEYHWDLDGQLFTLVICTHEGSIASIAQICPAADWAEREARDYFGVDFLGRNETPPLMLRKGDAPGVFRPEGGPP
jgi:hypothetical protein